MRRRRWSRTARTSQAKPRWSSSSSRAARRSRPRPARTPSCRCSISRSSCSSAPVDATYPESLRAEVEHYLEGLRFSEEALTEGLEEAMRYSLLAGGKRIRPVLALATARAIDDDDLRRGAPTCHVKYGEDVAILAGDGLYAEAFRHLLTYQRSAPERVLAAAAELATATGVNGMVGGQYADVRADAPSGPVSLRRLHELKTGRLIGASVLCVLLLSGITDESVTVPLRRFAGELGVLFQIVD